MPSSLILLLDQFVWSFLYASSSLPLFPSHGTISASFLFLQWKGWTLLFTALVSISLLQIKSIAFHICSYSRIEFLIPFSLTMISYILLPNLFFSFSNENITMFSCQMYFYFILFYSILQFYNQYQLFYKRIKKKIHHRLVIHYKHDSLLPLYTIVF